MAPTSLVSERWLDKVKGVVGSLGMLHNCCYVESATQTYADIAGSLGLTESLSKTKFLVARCDMTEKTRYHWF